MATTDKTVFLIDGEEYIKVWRITWKGRRMVNVRRKPLRDTWKCKHDWCGVAIQGHGKWRRGCSKCGALGR